MPLPTGGQDWPPKALAPIAAKHAEWDAWYVADPDRLAATYRGRTQRAFDRVSQHRGGVVGALARMWWGRPTTNLLNQAAADSDKLHLPVAADLAQASADMLFAEPPSLIATHKDAQAELDDAVENAGLITRLSEGAEVAAALGDVYYRVTWDKAISPRSFITAVHADAAWPEFRWGRLVAVTFWWVVERRDQVVIRHLERHELDGQGVGVIFHGLYEGTPDKLGRNVPLTEHASTEGLPVDADAMITTGTPGLAVEHAPNQTPQRRWRNDPVGRNLGRSDLDGVEPLMDKLDMVYSSWMRDIRLAKSRLIVPAYMLESNGPGAGASFDSEQDVYVTVNAAPREDGKSEIVAQQFTIRVAEHQQTAQQLLDDILRSTGYSRQTFGEGEDVAQTATEVTSKDRRSNLTRDRKIRNLKPALSRILAKKLRVDSELFGLGAPADVAVGVQFVDVTQADPEQLARTNQLLFQAQAASARTRVQLQHPDWDEKKVDDEAEAVLREFSVAVPDPTGFAPAGPAENQEPVDDAGES